ncbi:STAS domain-containing protein [Actinosynnema sp. NPDC059335]|uniref:STAS domain-containing protein n=1 Tax=Actinosynnema sp. NPDC059335 TaxID=3346804 RepID=UPI00366DEA79
MSRQPHTADHTLEWDMDDFTDAVTFTTREVSAGVVVVAVAGELDMATTPAVEGHVRAVLGRPVRVLVLDLSGVTFLGSTGINMLIALRAACVAEDTALRLVVTTKVVRQPLQLTGLVDRFTIVAAVDEAS